MSRNGVLTLIAAWIFYAASSSQAKVVVLTKDEPEEPAAGAKFPFYIYRDFHSEKYYPSGWMGDYGDLKLDESNRDYPHSGKTSIKISYAGAGSQGKNWAGIFWQNPAGNWGQSAAGGFNLSDAKRLIFFARGEKGGEAVEFKVGGISGAEAFDSATASLGAVTLTKEWKEYSIDLTGQDLSKIIGGFCFTAAAHNCREGCVFYVDDVYYSDRAVDE